MSRLLKELVAVAGLFLVALAATYAGLGGGAAGAIPGSWLLADLAGSAATGLFGPDGPRAAALVLLALAAALWYALVRRWTGNRIVGLAAAALAALHPSLRPAAADALVAVLPVVLGLAALLAREEAARLAREGASPRVAEAVALLLFGLALLSGPAAAAVALVLPPVSLLHGGPRRKARARRELPLWGVYGVLAAGLLVAAGSGGDGPRAWSRGLMRLLLLDGDPGPGGPAGVAVALAGLVALAGAMAAVRGRPRWLVVHAGFAAGWFVLALLPEALAAASGSCRVLAALGPALVLPAAAWRVLMYAWPDPRTGHVGPPPLVPPGAGAGPGGPEVTEAVRSGVAAAAADVLGRGVQAAVERIDGTVRALAEPDAHSVRRYAAAWERFRRAWEARAVEEAATAGWSGREVVANVFGAYLEPLLSKDARVLELGAAGGRFTRLLAGGARMVVTVDADAARLARARDRLDARDPVVLVRADPREAVAFEGCSFDLVFSYEALLHLPQPDVFLALREIARVLRPGGRAVLLFADLGDPAGFRQFLAATARRAGGNGGPVNFLGPELLRALCVAAGLRVVSTHEAANDRDLLAVLAPEPAPVRGGKEGAT